MADTQAMAAEALARIIYKLDDATGAPIRINPDGSTDGSVFVMTGNKAMNSTMGPTFNTEAAISTNCFTRPAVETVNGAEAVWTDCPAAGAMDFYSQFLKGWTASRDAAGLVQGLSIEDASSADCNTWKTAASGSSRWGAIELIGWRYCDNAQEQVRANFFREITEASPSAQLQSGLVDPGSATSGNINLKLGSNTGWGAGPGGVFPAFSDLLGAEVEGNPGTFGVPVGTPALYENLIDLCACNNGVRGVPLTAALVTANPELQTDLISGV